MLHMDRVLEIISEHSSPSALFVVVSSIGKTTDWLRDEDIQRVRRCYLEWAQTLNISSCIDSLWDNAQSIIDGHNRVEQRKDLVLSYGEQCSAYCLVSALQQRGARAKVLRGVFVDGIHGDAKITHFDIPDEQCIFIVPGFYGYDTSGIVKTIGASGSDITAGMLAKAIDGEEVIIYTDVDGVFTADPRRVSTATLIPEMNYWDVIELGFAGGNVLHPRTVSQLIDTDTMFWVRNLFDGKNSGTMISKESSNTLSVAVRDDQIFVTVEEVNMFGIPGISSSLFQKLAKKGINVSLITQSCSETSISFAMDESKLSLLYDIPIREVLKVSIVTLVGANMKNRVGMASQFFRALAHEHINVIGIAQGSTERSISAVVSRSNGEQALCSIHKHVIEVSSLFA
jgi:bifunctional aspartokinase / homoserine dehydrogenase 1